jgi:uncharacterized membrane protein YhaH (DUF805 family)
MHWLLDPITKHFADFSGRASRKEFWMFVLFCAILVGLPIGIIWALIGETVAVVIYICFILVIFVPNIALSIRRLHDTGRSGWWLLLSLVPYIGGLVVLVFYCLPSQVGTNKYGPNKYEDVGIGSTTPDAFATPVQASVSTSMASATSETVAPVAEAPVVGYGNQAEEKS